MTDKEILEIYHGWDKKLVALITEYVHKFHEPWSVYAPRETELINHCIETNTRLDDLPENDPVYKKYCDNDNIY